MNYLHSICTYKHTMKRKLKKFAASIQSKLCHMHTQQTLQYTHTHTQEIVHPHQANYIHYIQLRFSYFAHSLFDESCLLLLFWAEDKDVSACHMKYEHYWGTASFFPLHTNRLLTAGIRILKKCRIPNRLPTCQPTYLTRWCRPALFQNLFIIKIIDKILKKGHILQCKMNYYCNTLPLIIQN